MTDVDGTKKGKEREHSCDPLSLLSSASVISISPAKASGIVEESQICRLTDCRAATGIDDTRFAVPTVSISLPIDPIHF